MRRNCDAKRNPHRAIEVHRPIFTRLECSPGKTRVLLNTQVPISLGTHHIHVVLCHEVSPDGLRGDDMRSFSSGCKSHNVYTGLFKTGIRMLSSCDV